MWCLVFWVLVSATFLEAPARFPNHASLLSCWTDGVAWLERRNPETDKEVCHLTVFRVLFQTGVLTFWMTEPWPDSLEGWTNSLGMATGKVLGPVPSQFLPQRVEEETDHLLGAPRKETSDREKWRLGRMEALWLIISLELPGRKQQLRTPGDLGEGKYCDSLWMIVSAWLLTEWSERNFSFWKLQNQFFLHLKLKTTSLLKGFPREKLEVNPLHVLETHSQLCLRPQPLAN